jgi:hypothetical protein
VHGEAITPDLVPHPSLGNHTEPFGDSEWLRDPEQSFKTKREGPMARAFSFVACAFLFGAF